MTKKFTQSRGCIASLLNRKMKLLVVTAALVTGGLQAQTTNDTIRFDALTNGVGTWTCPADVTSMTVECWGGGGAGGSALSSNTVSATQIRAKGLGAGGAGGSYSKVTIENPAPGDYSYTVGVGATALVQGSTVQGATSNGLNTFFKNLASEDVVVAVGGAGGQCCVTDGDVSVSCLGGAKATTGNLGSVSFFGGAGANNAPSNDTGAGGGSAGSESDGGDATGIVGGAAGTGGGAAGAVGRSSTSGNNGGSSGTAPGAGGAGASIRATFNLNVTPVHRTGGKGGNGQIIITYTGGTATGLSTVKTNAFVTVAGKNLLLNGDINAVEVFNAQGKLIQSQGKVSSVNGLTNGIYIVKMHTPQGVNVQKVSIK